MAYTKFPTTHLTFSARDTKVHPGTWNCVTEPHAVGRIVTVGDDDYQLHLSTDEGFVFAHLNKDDARALALAILNATN